MDQTIFHKGVLLFAPHNLDHAILSRDSAIRLAVMTLKTLADGRTLLGHIPAERRELSTWQHVEKTLREGEPPGVSVALQVVLQMERVPFTVGLPG
jgi:hypothetical protein